MEPPQGCVCVFSVFAQLLMAVHMSVKQSSAMLLSALVFFLTLQSNVASFKVSPFLSVHSGGGR